MEPKTRRNRSVFSAGMAFIELLFHSIVRDVRTMSGNATLGLLVTLSQNLLMLLMFYLLYEVMGLRSLAIRGDFIVFLLTGIFLFLTHNKAIQNVMKAAGPTDKMMQHAPMSTLLSILATALSGLYLSVFAITIILFTVHVLRGGLEFYNPAGLIFPFFMAWASGVAIGLLFLVLRPFAPKLVPMLAMIYRRANMIASGKMIPANYMGVAMVSWFDWNPLFHTIDQARGAAFVNYFPRNSNMEYPVYFTLAILAFSLMVEFWLRKNMSQSWGKRSML